MKSGLWSRILGTAFLSFQLLGSWAQAADVQKGTSVQNDADTGMHLSLVPDRRYFVRLGAAYVSPKDKAGNAKDLSGPVVPAGVGKLITDNRSKIVSALGDPPAPGGTPTAKWNAFYSNIVANIDTAINNTSPYAENGIGIPDGVTQQIKSGAGTMFLSLGLFLDDSRKWSAEAFVLGAPLKLQSVGKGTIGPGPGYVDDTGSPLLQDANGNPTFSSTGKPVPHNDLGVVGSTKLLPLSVIFTRHFGNKDDKFRPTLGLMLSYNIFFETEASNSLQAYSGGPTKVKLKNGPAYTPMLGFDYQLDDRWTLNAQVGYQFAKTTATITTQVNPAMMATSKVIYDLAYNANASSDPSVNAAGGPGAAAIQAQGTAAGRNQVVYFYRALGVLNNTGDPNNDLGTLSRRLDIKADALVFMLTVAYAF